MGAANRTSNATFLVSNDPTIIRGRILAYNNDWFYLPYGEVEQVMVSPQDDDDAIVSADVSGGKITLGAVNDAGAALGSSRFDIVFRAFLKHQ